MKNNFLTKKQVFFSHSRNFSVTLPAINKWNCKMGKKDINEILQRNVAIMAAHTRKEDRMTPATGSPLPSGEEVKRIIQIVKSIIFTDYFHKRQADERMRSYIIGVNMEEL